MSSMEEQFHMMQQQIAALQEQLNGATTTPMQSADDTASLPLHSMGTRPRYDWSPSEGLTTLMNLDAPLHTSELLSDSERKAIIESYKAPATIPSAERLMNKGQHHEDNSLKQLQYQLSAVYRPLDILSHELVSSEAGNPNLERYCTMLQGVRKLLLHVGASMTHLRNNIALRTIDPSFSLKSGNEVNYTLPLDEFQQTLIQQTAARKATREATVNRRNRRRITSSDRNTAGWFPQQQQQQQQHQQQQHQQLQQFQQQQHQFSTTQQQEEYQPFSPINTTPTPTPTTAPSPTQPNDTTTDPVGGRLSKYFTKWITISNNSFVNTTIQHGYRILFHTQPPVTTNPTPIIPFSQEQSHLIDQAIQDLLQKSAIEKVAPQQVQDIPGYYSSMFVIPKKNGGVRPVFNLKRLNQYLEAPHFKMETIKEVSLMIKPNDYLVSIDLSDAFLHVGLHPDSWRFLRLKWRNQVYQYCTTAFGLASSPFVFTKVCKPILEHLRSQGFRISAYLDDWLLIAESKQLAVSQARQVVSLLQDLGWLINYKKSVLTPTQQLEHLGFVLNTRDMTALLPPAKLRDIRRSIKQVLDKPHRQSPRIIHSLTMRIQAATFAIFPARLNTRHLLYYKNQTALDHWIKQV